MHCCKISWLWPSTVRSIFTAILAKYTHLDTSIPVLQQLQPWIDTFVQLILRNNLKSFFHKLLRIFSAFFALLTLFPPPLDPECHFDMLCECAINIYWQKDMLGHGGGTHSKINYRALNETPDARSQQFFKNQLSMRSHTKSVCRIW